MKKSKMLKIFIPLLLVCLGFLPSCKNNQAIQKTEIVKYNGMNEKRIEISEKMVEGFPIGTDFVHGYVFIKSVVMKKRCFVISIINIDNLEVLKKNELPAGDYYSPTEYFSPVYIESIDNRYYVVDQFEKIVVYDDQFNHLYSSIYDQLRFFIDIFPYNKEIYFLIGTQYHFDKINCRVKLYQLPTDKKPTETMVISPQIEFQSIYNKNVGNLYHKGYFWPSLHGFEKNGRLYYAMGDTKEIHVYDIEYGKQYEYSLSYLEGKKFKNDIAIKFGFHNTDGWEERYFNETGEKAIYEAYQGIMYHFGIYDVGIDKIGIAADLNLENMSFRLDIIDIKHWEYNESIWLPIGYGFKKTLSTEYRGLTKGYINVDKGFYVHYDTVGDDFKDVVKITKFTKEK